MKQLYLARHAKSAWNTQAPDDFSRPLSKRGLNDAKRMGEKLAELEWNPQLILCSPARRAQQTCELLYSNTMLDTDIEWENKLYAASTSTLVKLLADIPESINSVMIIAHNPAVEWLLLDLCNDVPAQANAKIMTTGNVAKIHLPCSWRDLQSDNCQLVGLLRPKEI